MKKLIILLSIFIFLVSIYSMSEKEGNILRLLVNKEKSNIKNGLSDEIYFLYKKCNLTHHKCHELKPSLLNGSYYIDSSQEPYEDRMYLHIKNNTAIAYSLIYYDEEMVPTIVWSRLEKDKINPFTYLIHENTTISGLEYGMGINDFDFSNLENAENDRVKIGDTPKGKPYFSNQAISFNLEKNEDLSIDCERYLARLKEQNGDKTSFLGGVGEIVEMSCNPDTFFRNTAQYGEKRIAYFKRIDESKH